MFRSTRCLISALHRVKDRGCLHTCSQHLSDVIEYECKLGEIIIKINAIFNYINMSSVIFNSDCLYIAAPITDEYKKGPKEGRALYLDAQATTPLVSSKHDVI